MNSTMNIIVFGETGAGKSSVINLIAGGRRIAKTSPDAKTCTMSHIPYTYVHMILNRTLHIWETIGLEESEIGTSNYQPTIEQVYSLIQKVESKGGVDLLLFCFRPPRVTETVRSNYRLFYQVLCRARVPIGLVITHLEKEPNMESWWSRNAESLEKYGIRVAGYACVTGLPTHPKYRESLQSMVRLLQGQSGGGRFLMTPEDWFVEFLRHFGTISSSTPKRDAKRVMAKVLTKVCGMNNKNATDLANRLVEGRC